MAAPQIPDFRPGVAIGSMPAELNAKVRDSFVGLLDRPRFRARKTNAVVWPEGTHQFLTWTAIDEDPYAGWDGNEGYAAPWQGWYLVSAVVSLSGTGAAGTVLIPSVAVDGSSHTGFSGGAGWEGVEAFVPTGASTQPKATPGVWRVYANTGQLIKIDLWYSTEPAANLSTSTVAGEECRIELIWDGA
jgi:hypothetical protein